jgi:hypothetical protein
MCHPVLRTGQRPGQQTFLILPRRYITLLWKKSSNHGPNNPKCRLYCCLIEFKDWRYSQSYWYFLPLFFHWFTSPPSPLPCVNKCKGYVFIRCETGGEGIGLCGEHLQCTFTVYTVYSTRFRTYTIALLPQGASDRLTPATRSLHRSIFKKSRPLGLGVFIDIWSIEEMISCWKIPVQCSNEKRAYSY